MRRAEAAERQAVNEDRVVLAEPRRHRPRFARQRVDVRRLPCDQGDRRGRRQRQPGSRDGRRTVAVARIRGRAIGAAGVQRDFDERCEAHIGGAGVREAEAEIRLFAQQNVARRQPEDRRYRCRIDPVVELFDADNRLAVRLTSGDRCAETGKAAALHPTHRGRPNEEEKVKKTGQISQLYLTVSIKKAHPRNGTVRKLSN